MRNKSRHAAAHHPIRLRLFVYTLSALRTCPPHALTAAPAEWEPRVLSLLKNIATVVRDPRDADFYLVYACLTNAYFAARTRKHYCARCLQIDAEVVRAMRAIGRFWDELPHRHIVTHLECPRQGVADQIDIAYPRLWAARPTLVICGQASRAGAPDLARQLHIPYAVRHDLLLPVLPTTARPVELFYAGTFASGYPRSWLRQALGNSSRIFEFSSRDPPQAELEAARAASRRAKFVVVPPGDTPESVRGVCWAVRSTWCVVCGAWWAVVGGGWRIVPHMSCVIALRAFTRCLLRTPGTHL